MLRPPSPVTRHPPSRTPGLFGQVSRSRPRVIAPGSVEGAQRLDDGTLSSNEMLFNPVRPAHWTLMGNKGIRHWTKNKVKRSRGLAGGRSALLVGNGVIAEQQSEGRDFVGGRLEKSEGTRAGEKGDYQEDGQGGQGRSAVHSPACLLLPVVMGRGDAFWKTRESGHETREQKTAAGVDARRRGLVCFWRSQGSMLNHMAAGHSSS
ncbi:hypothetical protein B0T11DRAFT_344546 [Plectosphaerella cucumerina]|uniref:Uncharacterized protein n=1 Tax=Plectosphaerella cucumerina TaxID=40658 RepID=A0A8K0TUA0_9PEZI|nr:hypothetical protein B0T11DRAFT_344546 [Plectosphaerella cucumerina]